MPSKTSPRNKQLALKLLTEHPTWSNKDIANQVPGLSAQAVAMYRQSRKPPTVAQAAPKTFIDPLPDPALPPLDTLADLDEAPAPPPGAEFQPYPELDIRPHLHSGTSKLIDQIVPNLAEIATAVALRVAPEHVQPLIPSPQTAEVLIAAPCRIVARHSHIRVDEMSEDAKDVSAMLMAIGAWAVEIRANYTARADWLAQMNGANHGSQRANGAGRTATSPSAAYAGGNGASADGPAGGTFLAGAGGMAPQEPGSGNVARNGRANLDPDASTGSRLMANLFAADADGRRRTGLGR